MTESSPLKENITENGTGNGRPVFVCLLDDKQSATPITDIEQFKNTLTLHPYTQILWWQLLHSFKIILLWTINYFKKKYWNNLDFFIDLHWYMPKISRAIDITLCLVSLLLSPCVLSDQLGSRVDRVFPPCLGGPCSIPGRVKPNISNW